MCVTTKFSLRRPAVRHRLIEDFRIFGFSSPFHWGLHRETSPGVLRVKFFLFFTSFHIDKSLFISFNLRMRRLIHPVTLFIYRRMSQQKLQEKGIKYANIWHCFLNGGTSNEFLTNISIWKEECISDCKEINDHLIVNEGLKILFQNEAHPENLAGKLVQGFLCAIKEIYFKPHCNSHLTMILSASHSIEHQLVKHHVTGVCIIFCCYFLSNFPLGHFC